MLAVRALHEKRIHLTCTIYALCNYAKGDYVACCIPVSAPPHALSTDMLHGQGTTAFNPCPRQFANAMDTHLIAYCRWGDYQSMGTPVWPTRFIPMKTPLSHDLIQNWSLPEAPKHRLTVSDVIETHAAQGRRVGLFLDLSNHDCLYETDIPSDVQYQHIRLVAKELPPQDFVDEVIAAANKFWRANPNEFIAVSLAAASIYSA